MDMRLYPRMSPVASISEPECFSGTVAAVNRASASLPAYIVRGNITEEGWAEANIDVAAMERQARAARNAWIRSQLKSLFAALLRRFQRGGGSATNQAAARDLAERDERKQGDPRVPTRYY